MIENHWLKGVIVIGLFSLFSCVVMLMREPHIFPIKKVYITGTFIHTNVQHLQNTVSQLSTANFFTIDLDALQNVISHFPGIKNVSVHKQCPVRLNIEIQEYEAVAQWHSQTFVDTEGTLFVLNENIAVGLPRLRGPPGSVHTVLQYYKQLSPLIHAAGWHIHEFGHTAQNKWTMILENGLELRLHSPDRNTHLQRFINAYPHLPPITAVDLRYDHGFAVQYSQNQKGK